MRRQSKLGKIWCIFVAMILCACCGLVSVVSAAAETTKGTAPEVDAADLFANDADSSATIAGGEYTPTMGDTATRSGVLFSATEDASVSYQSSLLLNNSLETPLAEVMIVSDVQNAWGYDFTTLQITVTDKYDVEKKVTIDYTVYYTVSTNLSMIKAAATGQTLAGWHRNEDTTTSFAGDALHKDFGTFVPFGFDGTANTGGTPDYTGGFTSLKFYLKDNALYASPTRWKNLGNDANDAYTKIRDFGSADKYNAGYGVEEDVAFEGFTTGEVYISFQIKGVSAGKTAKVLLLGLNGQSMENEEGILKENAAPCATFGENSYAQGETGTPITLLTPTVYDVMDGESVYNGNISVTLNDEAVETADGAFTPLKPGEYTITYSGYTDSCGLAGEDIVLTVTVTGDDLTQPGGSEEPGGDDEKPGGDDEKPGGDDEKPGGDDEKPGGDDEKPGGDDEKPGDGTSEKGCGSQIGFTAGVAAIVLLGGACVLMRRKRER